MLDEIRGREPIKAINKEIETMKTDLDKLEKYSDRVVANIANPV